MRCQVLRDYFRGAPQCSGSCGTQYKSILQCGYLSSKCCQMKLLECANFGAIGSIVHVSKTSQVGLKPGVILSGSDYYYVYVK